MNLLIKKDSKVSCLEQVCLKSIFFGTTPSKTKFKSFLNNTKYVIYSCEKFTDLMFYSLCASFPSQFYLLAPMKVLKSGLSLILFSKTSRPLHFSLHFLIHVHSKICLSQ